MSLRFSDQSSAKRTLMQKLIYVCPGKLPWKNICDRRNIIYKNLNMYNYIVLGIIIIFKIFLFITLRIKI